VKVQNQNTNGIAGLCLSPADLALSKIAAGRDKDIDFVRALFRHHLLQPGEVEALLPELEPSLRDTVKARLLRSVSPVSR
jgi:hypothetical protein